MVVLTFRRKGDARHEPEGGVETLEAELGLDCSSIFHQRPTVKVGQNLGKRVVGQQVRHDLLLAGLRRRTLLSDYGQ